MAVIGMGWLYVVLMLAVAQNSIAAGLAVMVLLGLAPLGLVAVLRRRRRPRRGGPT